MNREPAALGVPVYGIFRGPIVAVDRYLSENLIGWRWWKGARDFRSQDKTLRRERPTERSLGSNLIPIRLSERNRQVGSQEVRSIYYITLRERQVLRETGSTTTLVASR
jgi:hypothetical protein